MTPLEALERIKQKHYFVDFELDTTVGKDCKEELDIIETALKALDVIKEKISFSEIKAISFNNDTEYYIVVNGKEIVFEKEKYDLLKEVML